MPRAMPVQNYKTWHVVIPQEPSSCERVDCAHWRYGWATTVDEGTDRGQSQAFYIRRQSGRGFTETRIDGVTRFVFAPGQTCFRSHVAAVTDRQAHAVYRGLTGQRVSDFTIYDKPEQWRDDLATQLDILRRAQG